MWCKSVTNIFLVIIALCSQSCSKHIHQVSDKDNNIINNRDKSQSQSEHEYEEPSLFSESELISEIIQHENEILDEKSEIEAGEGLSSNGPLKKSHRKANFPVPAYLKLIDDNLSDKTERFHKGPITRAWLPVQIKRNETTTQVQFQQTKNRKVLGDFMKAEVILTLKSDAEFNNDGGALVQILFNDGPGETMILSKNRLFYTFNVTSFILKSLVHKLKHPNQIEISFQVFEKNKRATRTFFDDLFDVQVERPFILFMYQELPENISGKIHETGRKKRAALDPSQLVNSEPRTKEPSVTQVQNSSVAAEIPTLQVGDKRALNSSEVLNSNRTLNSTVQSTGGTGTQTLAATSVVPPSSNCRKIDWSVDTDDIGWFEAESPKRLDLGYCAGSCPYPLQNDHYNFTLHSFFIDKHRMLKVFDVPKNFPRSCCVPVTYKPIRVFIMEEENSLIHVEYKDGIVDTCGCR